MIEKTESKISAKPKTLSRQSIAQLKSDVRALPDYARERWWIENQKLLAEQGFKIQAKTRKAFEHIVY